MMDARKTSAMGSKEHWEQLYQLKRPTEVSWYTPHLDASLKLLGRAGLCPESRVLDVGGGASTLVDDLLDHGITQISVLDISGQALAASQARLGDRAVQVDWIEGDVTQAQLPRHRYDIWHDRAVFHFLTSPEHRRRYTETASEALKPGGQCIIATFSLQGPPRCSGLEVVRYSPETLQAELGHGFRLVESLDEAHRTPFNTVQHFVYCRFQKASSP